MIAAVRRRGPLAGALCLCLSVWAAPSGGGEEQRHLSSSPYTVSVTLTTADMRQAMSARPSLRSSPQARPRYPLVEVNDQSRFQRFKGIGGAMTDSSAWLLEDELLPQERDRWMTNLFSRRAVGLNFLRVPIGASDFTVHGSPYSYDDLPPGQVDPRLKRFSIVHDLAYVIPALRQALSVNPATLLLASPWSPPPWMKGNRQFNNIQHKGTIRASDEPSMAAYIVKFLQAYASQGIHVKAITAQNEPSVQSNYPGATLPASQESDLIARYLHPALRRAALSAVSIYGYDGSWGGYAWDVAGGPAGGDLAGISWHCYVGSPDLMRRFHGYQPRFDQVVGECATPPRPSTSAMLIASFRSWANRVAMWNLALDPDGGPVQHPNIACAGCKGIITVDPSTHTAKPTLDYYQLAQFGHYVRPGATRIDSSTFVTQDVNPPKTYGLNDVAFQNPDGQTVLIVNNDAKVTKPFTVGDRGQYFSYRLAPGATVTFTWRAS